MFYFLLISLIYRGQNILCYFHRQQSTIFFFVSINFPPVAKKIYFFKVKSSWINRKLRKKMIAKSFEHANPNDDQ